MSNKLEYRMYEYKGYTGIFSYDSEDHIYYGRITGITDMVGFQTENMNDMEKEFRDAVDDYIEFRKECDSHD